MRTPLHLAAPAFVALTLVPLCAAQQGGSVELGGFAQSTFFDHALALNDAVGGGGRLGIFFSRHWALEGDVAYITTTGPVATPKVSYLPVHARLVYRIPAGERVAWLLGAGYVHNEYGKDARRKDDGVSGMMGIRVGLAGSLGLRLDGTMDYLPYRTAAAPNLTGFGARAGLSLLLAGHRGPRDRDRDGIADQADRCPATPLGAAVDRAGCPLPKDADRDGILDLADRCADTPATDAVDANGCSLPKDSDRDGVLDPVDRCPGTAPGEPVNATGCALPKDTDGDGILDLADRCPATLPGERVDGRGCPPPKDGDGDGVLDLDDKCPHTARGERVDAKGCPVLFEPKATALVLLGVTFETGKAVLRPESRAVLDRVGESLVANPEVRIEVAGYTDSRGTRATNLRLSQARAAAVRAYLIERGVVGEQLTARGYGPDSPVDLNTTESGRARNRRVELHKQ